MSDEKSEAPVGSPRIGGFANAIVHQNYLNIRQALIDRHWFGRLEIYEAIRGVVRKPESKRTRSDWDSFYFALATFVNSELGTDGYSARDPLPDTPATREDIRGALGIQKPALIRAMDEGKHIYTVDEMIAIAFVGNVDIAHMLTPTNDVLMLETEFRTSFPIPGEISALDWIMWISNLKPLPGQDAKDYLVNTSMPAIQRQDVNVKIKQLGDAGAHIKKVTRLPMSTSKALKSSDPDTGKVSAIRAQFQADSMPWTPKTRIDILEAIQRTLFLRMRLRTLTNLTIAKGSERTLQNTFARRLDFFTRDLKHLLNLFRSTKV